MLLAAGVLTWMIFWMRRTAPGAADVKSARSESGSENAAVGLAGNPAIAKAGRALFALAFLAVLREGVELALFLLAV